VSKDDPFEAAVPMQTFLSQTAEYALRALARIAAQREGKPLLARDLSVETRIPQQYLSKILRRLVLAGILASRKGRGGGFTLARPPGRIILRDVLTAIDAYPQRGRCAFGLHACSEKHPCGLHAGWCRLSGDFHQWATKTSFERMRTRIPESASVQPLAPGKRLPPAAAAGSRRPRRSGARTIRSR
jgi:Rrf2 family protein